MSALEANIAVGVAVLLLGLSALLAGIGLLTWRRVGHPKLGWVSLAFIVFAIEGAFLTKDFHDRRAELALEWGTLPFIALGNLVIVAALYMAVIRR